MVDGVTILQTRWFGTRRGKLGIVTVFSTLMGEAAFSRDRDNPLGLPIGSID